MTEGTLREQIAAITRFNFDGFTANGDPQGRWMLADDVLRILDAHTADASPDAVAEAEKLADQIEHALKYNATFVDALNLLATAGLTLRKNRQGTPHMTAPKIDTQAPSIGMTPGIDFSTGKETTMLTLMIDGRLDHASTDTPWGQAVVALLAERDQLRDLSAAREAAAWIAGRDAAVKLNDQQIQDYVSEHGMYDGSTGITEFPGDGEEWVGDREELSDALRAIPIPADPAAALDRLIAERVREARAYAREAIVHAINDLCAHLETYHDSEEESREAGNLRHVWHHLEGTLIGMDDAEADDARGSKESRDG